MILPTAYLAPISWYQAYLTEPSEIEVCESFVKQTLRNRTLITGTNGVQTLTVPIEHSERRQQTKDVRISYQTKWQHQHWMALVSAYRHTPYFQYLSDLFEPLYHRRYDYLIDFNQDLHHVIMRCLQQPDPSHYRHTTTWHADTNLDRFFSFNSGTCSTAYHQIFQDRHGFIANLSIVDMIFNIGNEAITHIL